MTVPDRPRRWRKSSHSQTDNCVEVDLSVGEAAVRDSKYPQGGFFVLSAGSWRALLAAVRD